MHIKKHKKNKEKNSTKYGKKLNKIEKKTQQNREKNSTNEEKPLNKEALYERLKIMAIFQLEIQTSNLSKSCAI